MSEKFLKGSLWKEGLLFVIVVVAIYQFAVNWERIMAGFNGFWTLLRPFVIGAVLAYFLSHPTRQIQKRFLEVKSKFVQKRARGFAVICMLIIIVLIFTGIITWLVPIIQDNLASFSNQLESLQINDFILGLFSPDHQLADLFDLLGGDDLSQALTNFVTQMNFNEVLSQVLSGTGQIVGHALNTLSTLFNAIISIIICLYVLLYTDNITALAQRTAQSFMRKKQLESVRSYVHKSNQIFINFVSAQFLDACILGTLATIILGIINVPYAVTLGVLLGIANMIPYFGSIFATLFAALITLLLGTPSQALIVLIALMILQQIDGNFIGPRITGQAIGLNPIIIIISISIGGAYFGVLGMFVSVPVAAMLKMFYFDYLDYRDAKRMRRGIS